jgi:REP element-mobilizing transposase RayT
MARNPRIELADAIYHVMAYANGQAKLFLGEKDCLLFCGTLAEAMEQFNVFLHGYCFLSNHVHLVVQTPTGNLSRFMAWLQSTFTNRHNRRHKRSGHLFRGRYKALLVDDKRHGRDLISYIHINPIRKKIKNEITYTGGLKELRQYKWSSHGCYAGTSKSPVQGLSDDWLKFWHADKQTARKLYIQSIKDEIKDCKLSMDGKVRGGLVVGGHDLLMKAWELLKSRTSKDAKDWVQEQELPQRQQRLNHLLTVEESRKIKIWLETKFSGRKKTELAQQYGYSDNSGIVQLVKRLEKKAEKDRVLARKLAEYKQVMLAPIETI